MEENQCPASFMNFFRLSLPVLDSLLRVDHLDEGNHQRVLWYAASFLEGKRGN